MNDYHGQLGDKYDGLNFLKHLKRIDKSLLCHCLSSLTHSNANANANAKKKKKKFPIVTHSNKTNMNITSKT